MLQTSFANDPPDTCRDYLLEKIERPLKGVLEHKWAEFLDPLKERFPRPERMETGSHDSEPVPRKPTKEY